MKVDGYKTYIGFVLLGLVGIAYKLHAAGVGWMEWFDPSWAEWLMISIGSLTGVAIRHAIKKTATPPASLDDKWPPPPSNN
ncbi:MAG: hypothetical protein ABIF82_12160 [Planctomycetota bacterium]